MNGLAHVIFEERLVGNSIDCFVVKWWIISDPFPAENLANRLTALFRCQSIISVDQCLNP